MRRDIGHHGGRGKTAAFPRIGRILSVFLLLLAVGAELLSQKRSPAEIPDDQKRTLVEYVQGHGMNPEDYVVSKFRDHDIVFIGEHHLIKHDVEFILSLIPILYKNGIRDLGIEFGCYELQDQVDALITAETYDADLSRRLMFQWGSYWPYVEYLDLYRKAWELNRSLPEGAPKFRIVNLDYRPRWDLLMDDMTEGLWNRVFFRGPRDRHMARVIIDEFVKKKKKALVYMGQHHAFTRFYKPEYDFRMKRLIGVRKRGAGNLVWLKIRGKAFNICLHYPWTTTAGPRTYDYPVDGVVDRVMKDFEPPHVGFDVVGSPFHRLGDRGAIYSAGRKKFAFGDFCDGYLFLKPFGECEGCTVDPLSITPENFDEAVVNLPNMNLKRTIKTVAQFLERMKRYTDIKRFYPDLE